MSRCSEEFKQRLVRRMMPANAQSVARVRRDSRAHGATLEAQGRRCLADGLTGTGL